jgi:hypothetical protein
MKSAMTALEIQYHYLERIEASANSAQLPEWARAPLPVMAHGRRWFCHSRSSVIRCFA